MQEYSTAILIILFVTIAIFSWIIGYFTGIEKGREIAKEQMELDMVISRINLYLDELKTERSK